MLIWPWWIPNCLSHFQDAQVWHKVSKDIEQVLEMHNIKLITHEEQSAQNIECTFTKLKTHNMANTVLTSLTMLLSFQCIVMTNEIKQLIHNNLFWKRSSWNPNMLSSPVSSISSLELEGTNTNTRKLIFFFIYFISKEKT